MSKRNRAIERVPVLDAEFMEDALVLAPIELSPDAGRWISGDPGPAQRAIKQFNSLMGLVQIDGYPERVYGCRQAWLQRQMYHQTECDVASFDRFEFRKYGQSSGITEINVILGDLNHYRRDVERIYDGHGVCGHRVGPWWPDLCVVLQQWVREAHAAGLQLIEKQRLEAEATRRQEISICSRYESLKKPQKLLR